MFTAVMSIAMLCLVATSGFLYVETMEELLSNDDSKAAVHALEQ